jgi:hypothetical protein
VTPSVTRLIRCSMVMILLRSHPVSAMGLPG